MRRFLFDTTVFVYALGSEHPYRGPCREIMSKGEQGLGAILGTDHDFDGIPGLERIDPADASAVDSLVGR